MSIPEHGEVTHEHDQSQHLPHEPPHCAAEQVPGQGPHQTKDGFCGLPPELCLVRHHDCHVVYQHPHSPTDSLPTHHHEEPDETEGVGHDDPQPLGGALPHHEDARQKPPQHHRDTSSTLPMQGGGRSRAWPGQGRHSLPGRTRWCSGPSWPPPGPAWRRWSPVGSGSPGWPPQPQKTPYSFSSYSCRA